MKLAIVVCASVLVFFAGVAVAEFPAADEQPDCTPFKNVQNCPDNFQPLCGTAGNTHANLCIFCKHIISAPNIKYAKNGTCITP